MVRRLVWLAPLAIVGMALFVALGGVVVEHLWNWLLPPLFGWHVLTFWQAVGLLALCRILFGNIGPGGGGPGGMRGRMRRRFGEMSAEDRERFRRGVRAHFGAEPPAREGEPD